ncbi:MAG: rhodanese-like domain-containing protein [Ramlibacter sp.]
MKFIIDNWMLIAVAVASGGMLLWPAVRGAGGAGLNPTAAVQLINREKAVVVDVGDAQDYAAGHVGGAHHVPLDQLEARLPEVVRNKSTPVLLVCASGGRAQRAQGVARKLGYEKAQVLAGGLRAWKEASLPLEKA